MPAVSKSQQKLFGIIHAIQTGRVNPHKFSKSARRLAKTMSHADVKKYATTHVENLPKKIEELLKQDINSGNEYMTEYDRYMPTSKSVEVTPVSKKTDKEEFAQIDSWIRKNHYLNKWPRAVQSVLAVKTNGKLSGVLVYGIGTRGQAATDIFGPNVIQNNQLWELQRAFTTDEAKKEIPNLSPMVISRGNEYIRSHAKTKDGKPVKAIVSYADSNQGHKGSVYRSTNATYLGEQKPRPGWAFTNPITGDTNTRTSKPKSSTIEEMKAKGYTIVEKIMPKTGKHKFVYALGKDQKEKNQLLSKIIKPIFSYPKDGVPSKKIENPAKQSVPTPNTQIKKNEPETKVQIIRKLLNSRVKNPETGNDILVKTALKYEKDHPSYKQARGMVLARAKQHTINVKPTRESLQEAVYVR